MSTVPSTHRALPPSEIDHVVVLHGVSWEQYEALVAARGESSVWVWEEDVLRVHALRDGAYEVLDRSEVLPDVDLGLLGSLATKPQREAGEGAARGPGRRVGAQRTGRSRTHEWPCPAMRPTFRSQQTA